MILVITVMPGFYLFSPAFLPSKQRQVLGRILRHLRLYVRKRGKHGTATNGYMPKPIGYECYRPPTFCAFNDHLPTFFIHIRKPRYSKDESSVNHTL